MAGVDIPTKLIVSVVIAFVLAWLVAGDEDVYVAKENVSSSSVIATMPDRKMCAEHCGYICKKDLVAAAGSSLSVSPGPYAGPLFKK